MTTPLPDIEHNIHAQPRKYPSMINKISTEEWDAEWIGLANQERVPLCEPPFSVNEIESIFGIQLLSYDGDGLGDCYGDPVEINGLLFWLQGFMGKQCKCPGVHLYVKDTGAPLETYLKVACQAFEVKAEDLRYIGEQVKKEIAVGSNGISHNSQKLTSKTIGTINKNK